MKPSGLTPVFEMGGILLCRCRNRGVELSGVVPGEALAGFLDGCCQRLIGFTEEILVCVDEGAVGEQLAAKGTILGFDESLTGFEPAFMGQTCVVGFAGMRLYVSADFGNSGFQIGRASCRERVSPYV